MWFESNNHYNYNIIMVVVFMKEFCLTDVGYSNFANNHFLPALTDHHLKPQLRHPKHLVILTSPGSNRITIFTPLALHLWHMIVQSRGLGRVGSIWKCLGKTRSISNIPMHSNGLGSWYSVIYIDYVLWCVRIPVYIHWLGDIKNVRKRYNGSA